MITLRHCAPAHPQAIEHQSIVQMRPHQMAQELLFHRGECRRYQLKYVLDGIPEIVVTNGYYFEQSLEDLLRAFVSNTKGLVRASIQDATNWVYKTPVIEWSRGNE